MKYIETEARYQFGYRRGRMPDRLSIHALLPSIGAGLALLWNLGSLIGMATSPRGDPMADIVDAPVHALCREGQRSFR